MIKACMWGLNVFICSCFGSDCQLSSSLCCGQAGWGCRLRKETCVWPTVESSRIALSLRKDRVSCACVWMQCVFLFCLCVRKYIYVCLCMCVSARMSAFATGGQQSACQNCFSCGHRALSLSVKTEPRSRPLPQLCPSLTPPPHVTTPVRPGPKHLTPVSSCTDYLVSAEATAQLILLSTLWI